MNLALVQGPEGPCFLRVALRARKCTLHVRPRTSESMYGHPAALIEGNFRVIRVGFWGSRGVRSFASANDTPPYRKVRESVGHPVWWLSIHMSELMHGGSLSCSTKTADWGHYIRRDIRPRERLRARTATGTCTLERPPKPAHRVDGSELTVPDDLEFPT